MVVGSKEELEELAIDPVPDDLHRPYIDRVRVRHPETGEEATRVSEVLDVWFDSGSMPFAQWGYPQGEASEERFRRQFPADFICEAVDQTRGWFYSLLAVSTMLFGESLVQELHGPRAHPRRRGQEDEQVARQRNRPVGRLREAGRRRPALGALHVDEPRQRAAVLSGSGLRGRPQVPAHPLEHLLVLRHLRPHRRLRPAGRLRRARRP